MSESRYVIGIGAQKSGTTWLADYFSGHPSVVVSPVKELHFFDTVYRPDLCSNLEKRKINNFVKMANKLKTSDIEKKSNFYNRFVHNFDRLRINGDIDRYKDYFANQAKNNESVFCDITPDYALLDPSGFSAIKSLADDVRIIFLMRNPVDRFWSAVRMWAKESKKIDIIEDVANLLEKPNFIIRTEYGTTLKTVYEVFPKERVFVQFYEHLFHPDSISALCHFCDVSYIEPDTEKKLLEGKSVPLTTELRQLIYTKFDHVYEWAENEFGYEALPKSWCSDITMFRK